MKRLLTTVLTLICLQAGAQTLITGKVIDQKGEALPGANVYIKDSYDGATTDNAGSFSFQSLETGEQVLVVSILGFEKYEKAIVLDGQEKNVSVNLKEAVNELKTVTIAAGAFEASDEKKMVILRPLDIVTTAGSSGDIYGAIQTLPGTGVVGEKEGLYVRGGDASEAHTFIDGLMVDNPYFSSVPDVPQRGRFSPFLFKGTSFSSGGYSAQYGQALSSALILETQDLPERSSTNLGLMSVGASIARTKRYENTSIGVNLGYFDLSAYYKLVEQNRDWEKPPRSGSGSFLFRHKTSTTGLLKAYVGYTLSRLRVAFPDTADPLLENDLKFGLDNHNFISSASFKEIIFKNWTLFTAASYSRNQDDITVDTSDYQKINELFESRVTLSHTMGDLSVIRFGGEYQSPMETGKAGGYSSTFDENYAAAYMEADVYITRKLVARTGLRGEYSKVLDRTNIAPRVSLAYKTGEFSQLSFAYGEFYQTPNRNYLTVFPNAPFKFEHATHYILNFQHVSDYRTFRIETYYKDYTNLVRFDNAEVNNTGYGHAKGFEIFYRDKKTVKRADAWFSYSFLDTKRLYLDYPEEAMPVFAAKHTGSVVLKYFFPSINLGTGMTYVYSSGRPYYNPNNSVYLGDRTKDYHNLSMNASYLTTIGKSFTVVVLSVGNVLGLDQVFTYLYSADGTHRRAVGPTADRMFFVGLFINLGSERDDSDKYN